MQLLPFREVHKILSLFLADVCKNIQRLRT